MSVDPSWWRQCPDILDDPETLLRDYVLNPQIPLHDPDPFVLPRIPNIDRLFRLPSCPAGTTIIPKRDERSGAILDFIEVPVRDAGCNAQNSMSLYRAPNAPIEATRGSAMNYPFWPGGFEEPTPQHATLDEKGLGFDDDLLMQAPGLPDGIDFDNLNDDSKKFQNTKINDFDQTINLQSIVSDDEEMLNIWRTEILKCEPQKEDKPSINFDNKDLDILEELKAAPVLNIAKAPTNKLRNTEWAEVIDVQKPVLDFEERIPEPAHKFAFELDTFQKQAVIKLEEHSHVFVAAHTSAGKTVVAEYAIALSMKHMTRAIYTSPIKALSNQKYRDFKKIFKDVGLITGDLQIDPTSTCLIMTTEILKSMLYCGSDVTRDLEFVILDEVHYINDAHRGHVWEEVLILLPDHVTIIMLSATVPNTLEFANWVGHIKKKKVYVICTAKRPVPLMHHLYVCSGAKNKDSMYLIVDENSQFLSGNFNKALEKSKAPQGKTQHTQKGGNLGYNQEKTMWNSLIGYLKDNDKLPMVAFTLSRNRCDRNLAALASKDLNTAKQKNHVHLFFQKCLQRLKPPDRELPQVMTLQDSLKRGIGVHHSGILPILKEIVEMLFQEGYVKLLFATETFAMGVNMPARTVIFDAHTKFDGMKSRMLRSAEYIQMAGRAGRRGLDKTGTVILVCKTNVPEEYLLRNMILGQPESLESRFRLTYAMILNLLRVDNVSVQDIMSHSFKEFWYQAKIPEHKAQLKKAEEEISTLPELGEYMLPLCQFFDASFDYINLIDEIMVDLLSQPKIAKLFEPGRVVVVTKDHHYNKLGLLLSTTSSVKKESVHKVLVLDHAQSNSAADLDMSDLMLDETKKKALNRGDLWHRMVSLTPNFKHFIPDGIGGHTILSCKSVNIVEISMTKFKLDPSKIIQNWEQRQIPRFRTSSPSPAVVSAVAELNNLNLGVVSGKTRLDLVNLRGELTISMGKCSNLIQQRVTLGELEARLKQILPSTDMSNFEQEFAIVYDRMHLERKREELKFKLSKDSLSLNPDYQKKLSVLKELKYIDDLLEVTMKGRVACEMGSNELVITELVFRNVFTDLEPSQIAALLSSLVFQAKTEDETPPSPDMKKNIEEIIRIDKMVSDVENKYDVGAEDDFIAMDRLNFGLVEVVYQWANNKPFADIMKLTDVQEGIIVRCIQQLVETLRDVKDAARIIGNSSLQSKMEEASNAIKRDIVFAASLYTQS